jgi:hypothetical protein
VKTTFRAVLTAAVLAASMACSNSTTSPSSVTSTTSNRASFNVAIRPSPIKATRCSPQCPGEAGGSTYAFSADMTIDVQDSASVGATVNTMTLSASADGTTFTPIVFSSDDIRGQTGTNHVDGGATLSIPIGIVYNTPSGGANLSISVSLQITDERGNQVAATGQVSVL